MPVLKGFRTLLDAYYTEDVRCQMDDAGNRGTGTVSQKT